MNIEFRSVVHYYFLQQKGPTEIHGLMEQTYGDRCPSLSFVKKWVALFNSGRLSLDDLPRSGRPMVTENIDGVKRCIEKFPFSSARSIASILNIDKNTVVTILVDVLGLKKRNAKWVPHTLTEEQILDRIRDSDDLLTCLNQLSDKNFMKVVTCDESWFYLNYYPKQAYLPKGKTLTRPKRLISDEKILIFTAFSSFGVHMVEIIPPKQRLNSKYLCNIILPKLERILRAELKLNGKKKIHIHWDNAKPHTSKKTLKKLEDLKMIKLPHPAYSPDVSPNDFYLYGYIKEELKNYTNKTVDDLFNSIRLITKNIPKIQFKSVMELWKTRLHNVITSNGEYQ